MATGLTRSTLGNLSEKLFKIYSTNGSKRSIFLSSRCFNDKEQTPPKKAKTPKGKLDEDGTAYKGSNVLEPFPNNINPATGERGGPRGPEPTRYGDWERKGRVTDF
ncbi:unnamed protein product [Clavelina lepadiformis]|uniref:Succinate dehydrogenase assembly factor 4, mitochondrial n=1 Tax=Clavelina lepadiformis TaxID=159417 RepID=A0ABP0EVK7_CLALP